MKRVILIAILMIAKITYDDSFINFLITPSDNDCFYFNVDGKCLITYGQWKKANVVFE